MKVVVLTYNNPHHKTQQVLFRLLAIGIKPLVVATEFSFRKSFVPIIKHRPDNALPISLENMCANLGLDLILTTKADLKNTLSSIATIDFVLLTTGALIEEEVAKKYKVINSHPGYLPSVKGLDALKWAIIYNEKVGVTSHFINEEIDGGIIIERKEVPLFDNDTFHSFAYRQYEMEIDMTISAMFAKPENIRVEESPYGSSFRRMPHRLEERMMREFLNRKDNLPIIRNISEGE